MSASLRQSASLQFTVTGVLTCSKSDIPLTPSLPLGTITAMVGFVPVVVTISGQLLLSLSATAKGVTSIGVTQNAFIKYGVNYRAQRGFSFYKSRSFSASPIPPQACIGFTAQASVGPRLYFLLYGVAGGSVNANAIGTGGIFPLHQPWWQISIGGQAGLGLEFLSYNKRWPDILSYSKVIAQSNSLGPLRMIGPFSFNAMLYQPFSGSITLSKNASPPIQWSILKGTLPPGLRFNTSTGVIQGTPTQIGSYPVVIQATDTSTSAKACGLSERTLSATVMITINQTPQQGSTSVPSPTVFHSSTPSPKPY